ncbi:MAG: dihydrolipoyl dehydrogenase [Sedimentisphaerales bacterium]|nr:dihydrolipoyl dehydrogenase [Sedimentisphaerales bacterium]
MAEQFDVVVIGGGPGGYAAAIRCAQKGATVALAEKDQMGGTCLNRGCIPSKALLGSAHFLTLAKHAPLMGLEIADVRPNWSKMQARKDAIVAGFRKGVTGLVQSNRIKIFTGRAIVSAQGKVRIEAVGGIQEIACKNIILATGSVPVEIPIFPFDGQTIISSTEALSLPTIPASMVIIGGGVIGCELACVFAAVGAKVTIVEALPQILPNEDEWVGKLMAKELKKLGIETMVAQKVTGVTASDGSANMSLESGQTLQAEKVLVAVGRRAFCDPETVQSLGLEMNGPVIKVNQKMETNVPGVYAIGDAVGTTYLAHGAFSEAEVAAANATGGNETMHDYDLIPRAVYTFPEVASVGKTEKKCAALGLDVTVGSAPFRSNGRSVAHNENVGEIRAIRDKTSNKIVGVTMVGATVTEMLAAARALIGSTEPITEVCFAHPTVSEVLKEAWEDAFGISLHVPPKR